MVSERVTLAVFATATYILVASIICMVNIAFAMSGVPNGLVTEVVSIEKLEVVIVYEVNNLPLLLLSSIPPAVAVTYVTHDRVSSSGRRKTYVEVALLLTLFATLLMASIIQLGEVVCMRYMCIEGEVATTKVACLLPYKVVIVCYCA